MQKSEKTDLEDGVVRSPDTRDKIESIPTEISLPDFIFSRIRSNITKWKNKPILVDMMTGRNVTFDELEDQVRRVASSIQRLGFKQKDVLYYVTYEMTQLYIVQVAVWLLGGIVRGSHQFCDAEEYARQLRETGSSFVLVDELTAPVLREAISQLDWSVQVLSVGDVTPSGAIPFSELLRDGECSYAAVEKLEVNPRDDVVLIINTSGSTGKPKGVLHTHFSILAMLHSMQNILPKDSILQFTNTAAIANFGFTMHAMTSGCTLYHINQFKQEEYFDYLLKFQPHHIVTYPFVASWFARCDAKLKLVRQADFLKSIFVGGWVLDPTTAALLGQELPNTALRQLYGSSECMFMSLINGKDEKGQPKVLPSCKIDGQRSVSSGELVPFVEAMVIDPGSGKSLGRKEKGEILIRSPSAMKGYLEAGKHANRSSFSSEGWYHSGDVGFFDDEGFLYITERLSFMFKYRMYFVSPSEIESVLQEHPAVEAAGVVGVMTSDNSDIGARAFVVLRAGCEATAEQLQQFVVSKLPEHKRLHGGVRFVTSLPQNRGFKLDRQALKLMALQEETNNNPES